MSIIIPEPFYSKYKTLIVFILPNGKYENRVVVATVIVISGNEALKKNVV